jgi:diketogulonate reductase-like aldo/keto reductase
MYQKREVPMKIPNFKLKSGHLMPVHGLGTWQLTGKDCEKSVQWALEMGYQHIDTSDDYGNEKRIGKALKGFDRSQVFITSKVDDSKMHRDDVIQACRDSLNRLDIDYLDLYLIHRPNPVVPIEETMKGMAELVERGWVRSIGISNFGIKGTQEVVEASQAPVCVNQIKIHPYHYPAEAVDWFKENGIKVTAYSPLDTGEITDDDLLTEIGKKYGKSAAQVSLRWLLQNDLIVIPKSTSKEHLEEDIDVFDWKLSEKDHQKIAEISSKVLRG